MGGGGGAQSRKIMEISGSEGWGVPWSSLEWKIWEVGVKLDKTLCVGYRYFLEHAFQGRIQDFS